MLETAWRGIAIISASEAGYNLGEVIRQKLKSLEIPVIHYKYSEVDIGNIWDCFDGFIFVMALEGAVRTVCKYIKAKHLDPPVVSIDDNGRYIIPIIGGHWGANEMAIELSKILENNAIITTASELLNKPNVEQIAKRLIAKILNPEMIVKINSAFLRDEKVCFLSKDFIINIPLIKYGYDEECKYIITTDEEFKNNDKYVIYLKPLNLTLGIGSKRKIDIENLFENIERILRKYEIDKKRIKIIASIREEFKELAKKFNAEFRLISYKQIEEFSNPCLTPPSKKLVELGLKGVAEIAALIAAGGRNARLVLRKIPINNEATVAIASFEG